MDGLNAASLGLMTAIAIRLSRTAFIDWMAVVSGLASAVLAHTLRVNTTWLILAGLAAGLLVGITRSYLPV